MDMFVNHRYPLDDNCSTLYFTLQWIKYLNAIAENHAVISRLDQLTERAKIIRLNVSS